jgi:hypothetical protein
MSARAAGLAFMALSCSHASEERAPVAVSSTPPAASPPPASPAPTGSGITSAEAARFALSVAPGPNPFMYDVPSFDKALAALPASAFTVHLDGGDVARWEVERAPSERVLIHLHPAAKAKVDALTRAVANPYFTISLDGKRLVGGMLWQRIGAAALRMPVLHVEPPLLYLGEQQGSWIGFTAGHTTVDAPALRDYFRALGLLHEVAQLR